MANITINEISQNYTYNIGNSSYACVALPITSSWGPGYEYDSSDDIDLSSEKIENSIWNRFQANQDGLESFVSTYRGPATHYLGRKDFSYQQAMTLMTAGYDILVCRIAGGKKASGVVNFNNSAKTLNIFAKYSGTFGNNLQVNIRKIIRGSFNYWNIVTYIVDATSSSKTAVENLNFVFDLEASTDNILHISEIESSFLEFDVATCPTYDSGLELNSDSDDTHTWDSVYKIQAITLLGGTDHPEFDSLLSLDEEVSEALKSLESAEADRSAKYTVMTEAERDEVEAYTAWDEKKRVSDDLYDQMTANQELIDRYTDLATKRAALDEILESEESTQQDKEDATAEYEDVLDTYGVLDEHRDTTAEAFTALVEEYRRLNNTVNDAYGLAITDTNAYEGNYNSAHENYTRAKDNYDDAANAYDTAEQVYAAKVKARDAAYVSKYMEAALSIAKNRYAYSIYSENYRSLDSEDQARIDQIQYVALLNDKGSEETNSGATSVTDKNTAMIICRREWMFNAAYCVLDALDDKLAYNPNRIIVPGWDDQDLLFLEPTLFSNLDNDGNRVIKIDAISPLHQKLMDVAYYSRCAIAYIDIPRSLEKYEVYNDVDSTDSTADPGYVQRLARIYDTLSMATVNGAFYSSHSAIFAPWGKYTYAGTGKQTQASPSFLALMIDRAMIKNQTSQYEWQLPTNRKNNLRIGKLDYVISKKYLDIWQSLEGVGVNCITRIPDIGLSIWGNSTLYEVPPATYQALANLSTRKLVNAVEDLAYRCGISITFNYNNDQAYNAFYAGMTPLLDTMRNVGAITDYYLRMAEDVNGLDQVNANSVIGKIYLVIDGVINDINIDLIALPPQSDLSEYRA